jgi:hypothetical protein
VPLAFVVVVEVVDEEASGDRRLGVDGAVNNDDADADDADADDADEDDDAVSDEEDELLGLNGGTMVGDSAAANAC